MTIFAVYNVKGGVGKTAAAVNLAYLSAQEGKRTLIADLDPQGACSFYLRTEPGIKGNTKSLFKATGKIARSIKGTDYRNLDILPADFSHRNMDLVLAAMKKPKKRLSRGLQPLAGQYDILFLDCPPNITLVSENVFNAADFILIPVIPTILSARTFEQIREFLEAKRGRSGSLIPFYSMVEVRKKLHLAMIQSLSSESRLFLRTQIPYTALIEKMGLHREPVECYARNSQAAKAYRKLWKEIKKVCNLDL